MFFSEKSNLNQFGIDYTAMRVDDTDKMTAIRLEIEKQNAAYLTRFEAQEAAHQSVITQLQGQYDALKQTLQKKEFRSYLEISHRKRLGRW